MIIKDKNKLKSGTKVRILVLGLMLFAFLGMFTSVAKAGEGGTCHPNQNLLTQQQCESISGNTWTPTSTTVTASPCALGKSGVTFQVFSSFIVCNINKGVIPLIFALALMMFVWGVVQYVINSSEEAKKEKGRQFMIWGIIALAVMVSVWGLVRILGNTFGIDYVIPQVKS